jgi:hypothetical protein
MNTGCSCSARHVQVTIQGEHPQRGVHLVGWGVVPVPGGPCPRRATQEDGLCDECREFADSEAAVL